MLLRLITLGALGYGAYRAYQTYEENERRERAAQVPLAGGQLSADATVVRPDDDVLAEWPAAPTPAS